jgi:hypothetical protein
MEDRSCCTAVAAAGCDLGGRLGGWDLLGERASIFLVSSPENTFQGNQTGVDKNV